MADEEPRRKRRPRDPRKSAQGDPSRWAHLIFALGGFLGAWVLTNAITEIWDVVWSYYPQVGRVDELVSNTAGIAIALVVTIWAWRKEKWFKFATEVVVEISQVTWPTKAETRAATIVVIVITLICSGILFAMDQIWSSVTDLLYGI